MAEPNTTQAPSSKNILKATGVAFVIGLIILLAAILPAEFGVDPLGIGELTGVIELSRAENPFEAKLEMHRTDYVEFELGPFQSVEYKYTMDLDAPMVFTWIADREVYFRHACRASRTRRRGCRKL